MRSRTGTDNASATCASRRNGDPDEADPPRHAPPRAGQSPGRSASSNHRCRATHETPASCAPISSPAAPTAPPRAPQLGRAPSPRQPQEGR